MSVGNSEAATVSLQREQVLLREDVVIHKMNFLAYYFFLLVRCLQDIKNIFITFCLLLALLWRQ